MKKLEPLDAFITKELLENTQMPKVSVEQAKVILVYQALRDNDWMRVGAWESLQMSERTFREYVNLLIKYGFIDSKKNH